MAMVASILARRGRLRWCEVDKRRPGVERLATTSLLSWLSHREVSSGVRRSGSSMPKRRGEREAVGAQLSARPSRGARGVSEQCVPRGRRQGGGLAGGKHAGVTEAASSR
jgi:hypothetical protein